MVCEGNGVVGERLRLGSCGFKSTMVDEHQRLQKWDPKCPCFTLGSTMLERGGVNQQEVPERVVPFFWGGGVNCISHDGIYTYKEENHQPSCSPALTWNQLEPSDKSTKNQKKLNF